MQIIILFASATIKTDGGRGTMKWQIEKKSWPEVMLLFLPIKTHIQC